MRFILCETTLLNKQADKQNIWSNDFQTLNPRQQQDSDSQERGRELLEPEAFPDPLHSLCKIGRQNRDQQKAKAAGIQRAEDSGGKSHTEDSRNAQSLLTSPE